MGGYTSVRPSKRRKVTTEANAQPPPPNNAQDSTTTRRSLRSKRETKSATDSAFHRNGREEPAPAHSSVQRKAKDVKRTDGKGANVEDQVNGARSPPVRSSRRLGNNNEDKSATTATVGRSTPQRTGRNAAVASSKTSDGPSNPRSKRSMRVNSKTRSNVEQENTISDTPTANDGANGGSGEHKPVDAMHRSSYATEQERGFLGNDEDEDGAGSGALDAATQLHHELDDADADSTKSAELPHYAKAFKRLCEEDEITPKVEPLGKFVLEKLCGKRQVPLKGLDSEYDKVHQLIEQTVVAGEGNSMLLLGARGCGKTSVVETSISALARYHREDFHVVRLNGFLHTDDNVALREIWRQLGREAGTEDELDRVSSYADTMATLLALLSHPEELTGYSETSDAIKTTKSVIIILDEFDLFASHPRQTLLYNLFDIAQAKKAPVAVLGLTTKVDITENLEKRVKSRFSHRYVFLPRPRSFSQFSDICLSALQIEETELSQNHVIGGGMEDTETALKTQQGGHLVHAWNTYLQGLWLDSELQTVLQQTFHRTRCPRDFFTCALAPLYSLVFRSDPNTIDVPTPASFASQTLACPDPPPLPFYIPTQTSTSATSLPLSLLLTATRLTALHEPSLNSSHGPSSSALTLSFAAVYAEYVRLLTTAKISASASGVSATPGRIWGKDVARESWEKLIHWGLIEPVGTGSVTGDTRTFRVEISFEEVVDSIGEAGTGALGRWWKET